MSPPEGTGPAPANPSAPEMDVTTITPIRGDDTSWIDELTDEQCMEIFWLYVDPPEPFLAAHPPELLGAAMRHALRQVLAELEP